MRNPAKDRRLFPRATVVKPCKLFHRASRRYIGARTLDTSEGGALISADTTRTFEPGEHMDLYIEWQPLGVVPAESMVSVRVVRTGPSYDLRRTIAVEFEVPVELAAAAA